jgi:hypothetical protein
LFPSKALGAAVPERFQLPIPSPVKSLFARCGCVL